MSEHVGVDIAPEDIRQIKMKLEVIDPNHQFMAAVVRMDKFQDRPCCPHCNSTVVPQMVNNFVEDDGKMIGDILICKVCEGVVIFLMYPILPYREPIILDWKMKP